MLYQSYIIVKFILITMIDVGAKVSDCDAEKTLILDEGKRVFNIVQNLIHNHSNMQLMSREMEEFVHVLKKACSGLDVAINDIQNDETAITLDPDVEKFMPAMMGMVKDLSGMDTSWETIPGYAPVKATVKDEFVLPRIRIGQESIPMVDEYAKTSGLFYGVWCLFVWCLFYVSLIYLVYYFYA